MSQLNNYIKFHFEEDPFETGSSDPHFTCIYNNFKLILTSSPKLYADNLIKVKINNQSVLIEIRKKIKASQIPAFIVINPYIHKQGKLLSTEYNVYVNLNTLNNVITRYYANFND